jgi:formylglycine-generating enzyme required for sulfatase activity
LKPNDLGLFDMQGNVWQWTQTVYKIKPDDKEDDGGEVIKGASLRVFRGGGWYFDAGYCRAAYRLGNTPVFRSSSFGFRLARVPVDGK